MKQSLVFIVALAMLVTTGTAHACIIPSDGMGVHEENIVLCKGSYNLTHGIYLYSNSSFISSLDCNGSILTGSGNYNGITISKKGGIVKNCIISNYEKGIDTGGEQDDYARDIYIFNNTLYKNNYGIYLGAFLKDSVIKNNTLYNNSYNNQPTGIYSSHHMENVIIVNNTIYDGFFTQYTGEVDFCLNNSQNNYINGVGPNCSGYYAFNGMFINSNVKLLKNDYKINTTSYWLRFSKSNVTLDCAGSTITGTRNQDGVSVYGTSWNLIKNCNFYNLSTGINVELSTYYHKYSDYTRIINNTFTNNKRGIRIGYSAGYSKGYLIENNTFINNSYSNSDKIVKAGIYKQETSLSRILNNKVYDAIYTTVTDDTIYCNNLTSNYYYENATGPTCEGYYLYDNMQIRSPARIIPDTYYLKEGIEIVASHTALDCQNATLTGVGQNTGISADYSYINISNCNIVNFSSAIYMGSNSRHNLISHNSLRDNLNYGLRMPYADNNTINNNLIINNKNKDLYLSNADYNIISNNNYLTLFNNTHTNIFFNNSIPLPDISVASITSNTSGNNYSVKLQITNHGVVKADNFSIILYESNLALKSTKVIYHNSTSLDGLKTTTLSYYSSASPSDKLISVVVDPDNTVKESNEKNNFGRILLFNSSNLSSKPVITKIIPEYKGTLIVDTSLIIANNITVEAIDLDNDITTVKFIVGNTTYYDNDSADGWGIELPIKFQTSTEIVVSAIDSTGKESDPKTLEIQTVAYKSLPAWISKGIKPLNASLEFIPEQQAYKLLVGLTNPVSYSFSVPPTTPVVGGNNYLNADLHLGVLYIINNNKFYFYGDGYASTKVFQRDTAASLDMQGLIRGENLTELEFINGSAGVGIKVEAFSFPYTYTIPYLNKEVGVSLSVSPQLKVHGNFIRDLKTKELNIEAGALANAHAELDMSDVMLIPARAVVDANGEIKIVADYEPVTKNISVYGRAEGDVDAIIQFAGFYKEAYAYGWYTYPEQSGMNNSYYSYGFIANNNNSISGMFGAKSLNPEQITYNHYKEETPHLTTIGNTTYITYAAIFNSSNSILNQEIYLYYNHSTIRLTNNRRWDFSPVITPLNSNALMVVWVENTKLENDEDINTIINSLNSSELFYRVYYISNYSLSQTARITNDNITDGLPDIISSSTGVKLVWVKDLDSDILTGNDREIYYGSYNYSINSWNIQRITNNSIEDSSPVIGKCGVLAWRTNTSLAYYTQESIHSVPVNISSPPDITCGKEKAYITFLAHSNNNYSVYLAELANSSLKLKVISSSLTPVDEPHITLINKSVLGVAWRKLDHYGDFSFKTSYINRDYWTPAKSITNNSQTDISLDITSFSSTIKGVYLHNSGQDVELMSYKYDLNPDVIVNNISIIPAPLNHTGNLTVEIANLGELDANNVQLVIKKDNQTIKNITFSVNYSNSVKLPLNITLTKQCTLLTAVLNPDKTLAEHNYTNNIFSKKICLRPDFTVTNIILNNSYASENKVIMLTANISNKGLIDSQAIVYLYNNNSLVNNLSISIPAKTARKYNFTLAVHKGFNNIWLVVDKDNRIEESNESNNNYNLTINIHPECIIREIQAVSKLNHFIINASLLNNGTAAGNCSLSIFYNDPFYKGTVLAENKSYLKPLSSLNISLSYNAQHSGMHYFFALASTNNINTSIAYASSYILLKPDPSISVYSITKNSAHANVSIAVKNNGVFSAGYLLNISYLNTTISYFIPSLKEFETRIYNISLNLNQNRTIVSCLLNNLSEIDANPANNKLNISLFKYHNPPAFTLNKSYIIKEDTELKIRLDINSADNFTILTNNKYALINLSDNSILYRPFANTSYNDSLSVNIQTEYYNITKQTVISVIPVNDPPFITSTPPENATEGQYYSYIMKAVDIDSENLTYYVNNSRFTQTNNRFSFIPNQDDASKGRLHVLFRVSDGSLNATQEVIISIRDINHAPVISRITDKFIYENSTITLNPDVSDADNDSIRIYYSAPLSNGSWTPGFNESGIYNISITASDGSQNTTTYFTLRVLNRNRAPVVNYTKNISWEQGKRFRPEIIAYDPDDDNLFYSYSYPLNTKGIWENPIEGRYNITVNISDGEYIKTVSFRLSVIKPLMNISVSLTSGWNLINIPLNSSITYAQDICSDLINCSFVSEFDSTTQHFITHPCSSPINNFPISPKKAYFVFSNVNKIAYFKGTMINTSISYTSGWNTISAIKSNAEEVCGINSSIDYVSMFNSTNQHFLTHPCGLPINNFQLVKGKGYFLHIKED